MYLLHRDGICYTGENLLDLMYQLFSISITEDRRVRYHTKYSQECFTCNYSDEWSHNDMMNDAAKCYMIKTANNWGWRLFKVVL